MLRLQVWMQKAVLLLLLKIILFRILVLASVMQYHITRRIKGDRARALLKGARVEYRYGTQ